MPDQDEPEGIVAFLYINEKGEPSLAPLTLYPWGEKDRLFLAKWLNNFERIVKKGGPFIVRSEKGSERGNRAQDLP